MKSASLRIERHEKSEELGPCAYLITAVNQHLAAFRVTDGEVRRRIEQQL